ncbi:MAG: tetratricopeptide repeat protein [Beijerinckiaceae bacterium]
MTEQILRLFVSSPGDVQDERRRIDLVVERLNAEFEGRVKIDTIRWETSYYSAHDTFQKQIPEAADCDVVVALFRGRLGTPLPAGFPPSSSGEPYPSGTAYEVLTAIEARKAGKGLPDIYVFRYPEPPSIKLDDPAEAQIKQQWEQLKGFFDRWFKTQSGEFIAAFQTYVSTDDFAAKLEDCLRQWLARRGCVPQGPMWDRVLNGSPFPGLAAFEANRGSVFFGRDLAIAQALERLREAGCGGKRVPFLLVIGASGSGKSSLLRAGLLPRLVLPGAIPEIDLWRPAIVTPGPEPFLSLADALFADAALGPELRQGTFRSKELLAKQLAGDKDTALAPLRDALAKAAERRRSEAHFEAPRPVRLALAIDQAERLFVEADAATATAFADLLAALTRQNLAYVIMALRSDAYARFQNIEALVGLREAGATFDLVPPSAAELEEIVRRPVAACHPLLAFEEKEGHSLASLLVKEAKGGDALPLLQMTLSRLYAQEAGRGDGVLRFADYRGMDAAVTETANEALDGLSTEARAELPALVAGLVADVAADPLTGAPVPVVAALDRQTFEARKPARAALVEAFVGKRLLTAEGDNVSQLVRPTHEALLRIWPQAVAIVTETASLIRVRHTLAPMVREWREAAEADRARHLDISPALLDGAQQVLARMGDDLPEPMRDFIGQAAAADAARRDRERQEQERRLRDAQTLAAANKRTAQRTFVGLAVALFLVALAGWQWRNAEVQRAAAQHAEQEANTQRDRAQHSLALATGTANGLIFDLARKLRDVAGIPKALVKDILDRAVKLQNDLTGAGETSPDLRRSQGAALNESAGTFLTLGATTEALAAAEKARSIWKALAESDKSNTLWQRDLSVSDDRIGDVLVAQGQLDAALAAYRAGYTIAKALAESDKSNTGWQRDLSLSDERIGGVLVAHGKLDAALAAYRESYTIRKALADSDKSNTLWQSDLSLSDIEIGDVLKAQGKLEAALATYRAGYTIAKALAESDKSNTGWQRDLSLSDDRIGDVLVAQGQLDAALAAYREAYAIRKALADSDNSNTGWQRDLSLSDERIGGVLVAQGKLDAALAAYRAGYTIAKALAEYDKSNTGWQRDLSLSDERIGDVLVAQGQLDAALAAYREAYAIAKALADSDNSNTGWQRDLSVSDDKIGDVLVAQGQLDAALAAYREAYAIRKALADSDKSNTGWQRDLSLSDERIGDVLKAQGKPDAALAAYREAYAIAKALAESDMSNTDWQRDLSLSDIEIGDVLKAQGKLEAALATYREAYATAKALVESDKNNTDWQRDLSLSDDRIGNVLQAQGELDDALNFYKDGLNIRKALVAQDGSNTPWQSDLSISIGKIGGMAYYFVVAREFPQALDAADLAISLAPDKIWIYTNRAHALMFLGRTGEARALYLAHRGEKTQGDKIWEVVIEEDFAELRKAGLTNPLMDEIEKIFAAKK